jgi:hypothetical protein
MIKVPTTKFGKILNYIKNPSLSRLLLSFMHNGYLLEIGWFRSFKENKCIDENGEPIPWSPYPYIQFLKDNLTKEMSVFEYGSGYSTLFFAKRAKKVYTVEHNREWIDKMELDSGDNIIVIFEELGKEYEESITKIPEKFDFIIIDGRRRVLCIKAAIKKLKENGFLVLDDSDRNEYQEEIDYLLQSGFKVINFWGPTPLAFLNRKTSVFFKQF